MSLVKTVLTAAALGVTAYSRGLGKVVSESGAIQAKYAAQASRRAGSYSTPAGAMAKLD